LADVAGFVFALHEAVFSGTVCVPFAAVLFFPGDGEEKTGECLRHLVPGIPAMDQL